MQHKLSSSLSRAAFMSRSMSSAPLILPPTGKHVGSVIFLHGLGDTGYGWIDGMEMVAHYSPHIKFILPHAPQRRITINHGEKMPGWYDITSFNFGNRADDIEGLKEAQNIVGSLIEAEVKAGIPEKNIFVGGFSQGAVVSIFTVFQYPKQLAGCISLSGYLPMAATFHSLINQINTKTPLLMYHGSADQVIPIDIGEKSRDALKGMGLDVKFTRVPNMPHTASEEELVEVSKFINQIVPPP